MGGNGRKDDIDVSEEEGTDDVAISEDTSGAEHDVEKEGETLDDASNSNTNISKESDDTTDTNVS